MANVRVGLRPVYAFSNNFELIGELAWRQALNDRPKAELRFSLFWVQLRP